MQIRGRPERPCMSPAPSYSHQDKNWLGSGKLGSHSEGMPVSEPEDGEYALVMPLVVCESNGGTYQDHAFVAGCEFGHIEGLLEAGAPATLERYVRTETMPQYDLLAMHAGYSIKAEPWDEHPDEWTYVVFTKNGA